MAERQACCQVRYPSNLFKILSQASTVAGIVQAMIRFSQRMGADAHPLFSLSSSGLTTCVGISSMRSSGSPECSSRVQPPMWQIPFCRHSLWIFLYLQPPGLQLIQHQCSTYGKMQQQSLTECLLSVAPPFYFYNTLEHCQTTTRVGLIGK